MMNKKLSRTLAVSTVVLILAAVPAFAKGNNNNNNNRNDLQNTTQGPKAGKPGKGGNYNVLGTVTAVNTTDSILTIKNADGKEVKVHVNPQTFINVSGNTDNIKIADVKVGDWAAIASFNTETTVIEARHIAITRN